LLKLYGAEYFTEDEWIKIDDLIHKGNYVFTNGPPSNLLDLMSFGDEKTVQDPQKQASRPHKQEPVVAVQELSPPSSNGDMTSQNSETPNETSESSNGDALLTTSSRPMFEFSDTTTTLSTMPTEQPVTRLPPGITQEQLDIARSMAASMTKAGGKPKREQYTPINGYASSNWTETVTEYASPAPAERENHIISWASEVDAAEAAALVQDAAAKTPLPTEAAAKANVRTSNNKSPKKSHNKGPQRAESRASTKTISTVKPTTKHTPSPAPSAVASNTRQRRQQQRAAVAKKVQEPQRSDKEEADAIKFHRRRLDNIETSNAAMWDEVDEISSPESHNDDKLPAHSKIVALPADHVGDTNKWNKVTHQPESHSPNNPDLLLGNFENYDAARWNHVAPKSEKVVDPPASINDLENSNASEWDEVPIRKQKKNGTSVVAPTTKKSGIVASKFAALEVETTTEPRTYTMEEIKAFGEVFDTDVSANDVI
jgi:hypothetical protein